MMIQLGRLRCLKVAELVVSSCDGNSLDMSVRPYQLTQVSLRAVYPKLFMLFGIVSYLRSRGDHRHGSLPFHRQSALTSVLALQA